MNRNRVELIQRNIVGVMVRASASQSEEPGADFSGPPTFTRGRLVVGRLCVAVYATRRLGIGAFMCQDV